MIVARRLFEFCPAGVSMVLVLAACSGRKPVAPPPSPASTSDTAPPAASPGDGGLRDLLTAPTEEEWFRSATVAELEAKLSDVYFDYDRDELRSDTRASVQKNHEWLAKPFNTTRIELEGHCDERGTEGYNLALGARRTAAVARYLGSLGLGPDRLTTISYGKERPQCRESAEECWWKNRRVRFRVVSKEATGAVNSGLSSRR